MIFLILLLLQLININQAIANQKNKNNIIFINKTQLTQLPRNSSSIVLFTYESSSKKRTTDTTALEDEFKIISSAWTTNYNISITPIAFIQINIVDSETELPFKIPNIVIFPTNIIDVNHTIDIQKHFKTEEDRIHDIVDQISRILEVPAFQIKMPTDYVIIFLRIILALNVSFLIYRHHKLAVNAVQSKFVWAFCSLTFIILMISGHMYKSVNKLGVFGYDENGMRLILLRNKLQKQYGIETYYIFIIHSILLGLVVLLTNIIPLIKPMYQNYKNPDKGISMSAIISITCSILIILVFSVFRELFQLKYELNRSLFNLQKSDLNKSAI
ncbi:hypothetical protein TBLA_0J02000 [Henningerozyma blattae CBS 6284]|uniref:Uncharacterized protein n=1 Tax=Henningerozyma blattae (strain ATCC 34711 / CBS 6284 / DSM 70876 / NBRC 10599 / NRRL Y-10934 / UCD 77-7) TaxID=1071380 RepID=I2H9Z2_HENB6|nr:hypothetical protein TBLA_0J02000 [Tetrapisispora blattae CBS 6284]CCH63194.1 hypothetical protein TBLA_0J02000 [Tetrapisispora blattae CBS 6284]